GGVAYGAVESGRRRARLARPRARPEARRARWRHRGHPREHRTVAASALWQPDPRAFYWPFGTISAAAGHDGRFGSERATAKRGRLGGKRPRRARLAVTVRGAEHLHHLCQ